MKTEEEVKLTLSELEKQRDDLDKHVNTGNRLGLSLSYSDLGLLLKFYEAQINILKEVLGIKQELPF